MIFAMLVAIRTQAGSCSRVSEAKPGSQIPDALICEGRGVVYERVHGRGGVGEGGWGGWVGGAG